MISKTRKVVSLVLKLIVFISALIGITLSAVKSSEYFMGGHTVFMYFTIQSNILIALVCLIGFILLLSNKEIKRWWYVFKFISTVSITLTGVVFCFVLAPTMGKNAWTLNNIFTHVVVPLTSVIDFFVIGIYASIKYKEALYVLIPPLLYLLYAGIGYILKFDFGMGQNYPYFFLNWGSKAGAFGFTNELPFMGVVYWIILLLLFIIAIGYLYLLIIRISQKRLLNKTN